MIKNVRHIVVYLIVFISGLSFAYGNDQDSTEIKLQYYKELFTNGLINESEYTKLKQSLLFPANKSSQIEIKQYPLKLPDTSKVVTIDTLTEPFKRPNYFFITPLVQNGTGGVKFYSGEYKSEGYNGYYLSAGILVGYSVRGVSFSTGLKSKFYFTSFVNYIPNNPGSPIVQPGISAKYYFLTLPINIDYDINIFSHLLFLSIGIGGEVNTLLKQNNEKNGISQYDVLEEDYNKFTSFGIAGRIGLEYSISQLIGLYANFNYERNINTAYQYKVAPGLDFKAIPTSLSAGIGIRLKF